MWAIDDEHLRNYLVPRECPRVTFAARGLCERCRPRALSRWPAGQSSRSRRSGWNRVRSCRLFCYHLPGDTFRCIDETAAYFVSHVEVQQASIEAVTDLVAALLQRGVELRVLQNLWALRDAVIESTLEFSIIRWRNALPRSRTGCLTPST